MVSASCCSVKPWPRLMLASQLTSFHHPQYCEFASLQGRTWPFSPGLLSLEFGAWQAPMHMAHFKFRPLRPKCWAAQQPWTSLTSRKLSLLAA